MKGMDRPVHGNRTGWRAVTHTAGTRKRGMVLTFVVFFNR